MLSDVQFTGTRIGGGAYGRVDEVAIPVSAAAGARHGATADEPSRLAGSGNPASARRPQTVVVLHDEPKVLCAAQRGQRPRLPPRANAARHPPGLVRQKRSPELGAGRQDSGPGRGSYRASYESCSHHDHGAWGHRVYASRDRCITIDPTFRLYS